MKESEPTYPGSGRYVTDESEKVPSEGPLLRVPCWGGVRILNWRPALVQGSGVAFGPSAGHTEGVPNFVAPSVMLRADPVWDVVTLLARYPASV